MALIPTSFPDCVVAIGAEGTEAKEQWVASGFFFGHFLSTEEEGTKTYRTYLVSNRHVFEEMSKAYVRCNPQTNEPARVYHLSLEDPNGKALWFAHPDHNVDVAVVPVDFNLLEKHGMQASYFRGDTHAATTDKLVELGITEGDFAYVLGFPMGLIGGERNVVLVRSGSIARIRDALAKASNEFLVDAFVFPGNSGGPVISKPEKLAIKDTKSQDAAYLIGVVRSYVSYREEAVSTQTGRTRAIFEENSGLAAVHPVDFIEDAIQQHLLTLGDRAPTSRTRTKPVLERIERIRRRHPRAYERWTEEEEARLLAQFDAGCSIQELGKMLQRQDSAIRSRLRRLGRIP